MNWFRKGLVGLLIMMVVVWVGGASPAMAKEISRQEAIASIAKTYPTSEKSPETIYEEREALKAARQFARRLMQKNSVALAGALKEDSIRTAPVKVKIRRQVEIPQPLEAPSAEPTTSQTDLESTRIASTENPPDTMSSFESFVPRRVQEDTVASNPVVTLYEYVDTIVQREMRVRSSSLKAYEAITGIHQGQDEQARRQVRASLDNLFKHLPPNIFVEMNIGDVTVSGSGALINATYHFRAFVGETNRIHKFRDNPTKGIELQLWKRNNKWLVSNLEEVVSEISSSMPQ